MLEWKISCAGARTADPWYTRPVSSPFLHETAFFFDKIWNFRPVYSSGAPNLALSRIVIRPLRLFISKVRDVILPSVPLWSEFHNFVQRLFSIFMKQSMSSFKNYSISPKVAQFSRIWLGWPNVWVELGQIGASGSKIRSTWVSFGPPMDQTLASTETLT